MIGEVLETCDTRPWAEVLLNQYARTIKATGYAEQLGVRMQEMKGKYHIVLVRRTPECDYDAAEYGGAEE